MSENNQAPTPEEMGAKLDEEIKETAQDWTDNPEASNFSDLNKRADVKVRRTLAGWVGADENADWKDVGAKMDENTRSAIAGWVGLEESADWPAITGSIESRIRQGLASAVHAEPARAGEEPAEPSWVDIGSKIESDVRSWVAGVVGTPEDADWGKISNEVVGKVKDALDKMRHSAKDKDVEDEVRRAAQRISIEGEEAGGENPPNVASTIDPVEKIE